MVKDIVIIGAGGFGREVQWLIESINEESLRKNGEGEWNILGYIDDGIAIGTEIDGYEVIGNAAYLVNQTQPLAVACAIGTAKTRKKVIEKIQGNSNLSFPNLIDPSVKMSRRISLGEGNIVCAGNILTVDIEIKDFCIINLDCTVGHDVEIESFVTLYPSVNVSGCVEIGQISEIGTGAQIIQGKKVISETIIGAGAVVVNDIEEQGTYIGIPARPITLKKSVGGVIRPLKMMPSSFAKQRRVA